MIPTATPPAKHKNKKGQKSSSAKSPRSTNQSQNGDYFDLQSPRIEDHASHTPMSQARALEGFVIERSYLLNTLQQENSKATDLLRRIPYVERDLSPTGEVHVQRKIRKQLGWLKHRLAETNKQEQAILARLGHLTYEIHCIERWSQLEAERQQPAPFPPTPILPQQNCPQMSPNPMAQEFQPQQYQFPPTQWSTVQWPQQQYEGFEESDLHMTFQDSPTHPPVPGQKFEDDDQISPKDMPSKPDPTPSKPAKRPPLARRASSMNSAELDVLSTNTTPSPKPFLKRHSIPIIPGVSKIWAPTDEEIIETELFVKDEKSLQ